MFKYGRLGINLEIFPTISLDKIVGIVAVLTIVAISGYGLYSGGETALYAMGLQSVALPGLLAIFAANKIRSESKGGRRLLIWLGVFAAFSFVAESYSFLNETYFMIGEFPSVADVFWLVGYGALFVFFAKNLLHFKKLVNKSLAMFAVGVSVIFLIPGVLIAFQLGAEESMLGLATTLSYPISDAIIMIPLSLGMIIFLKGVKNRSWVFLFLATSAFMIGDFVYPYYEMDETYHTGHPIDVTWIFGYLFFIFAVLSFDGRKIQSLINLESKNSDLFKFENIHRIIVPLILGAIVVVTFTTIYQVQALDGSGFTDNSIVYWLVGIMIAFTGIILAINHNLSRIVKIRTNQLTKETEKLESEVRQKTNLIQLQKHLEKEIAERNKELVKKSSQLEEQNEKLRSQSEELESQHEALQIQNEKLLEVDKQKAEFASMVTHELKTPLTPILSWCEVLLDHSVLGHLNEGQKNAVTKVRHNATKLLGLISDILDAEKLGLGQMKFNLRDVDIEKFAKDLSENYAPVLAEKKIQYVVSCPKNLTIHIDESRLAQVLKNFINNSMDFVPKENGKIELKIEQDLGFAIFSVIDNGIGIPKEKQSNLFQKFYQIDTSATRKHGGSGLGLSICKGIIESFGGNVGVKSELGVGSIFYFKIPLKSDTVSVA